MEEKIKDLTSNVSEQFNWQLICAIREDDVDRLCSFCSNGVNVNTKISPGWPLLTCAINFNRLKCAEFLLEHKADINMGGLNNQTALYMATKNNNRKAMELLLKHGADFNVRTKDCDLTPIHKAAKHGYVQAVKLLLENSADVNKQTQDGYNPLDMAAANGQIKAVELLLQRPDIDLNARSKEDETAADIARNNDHPKVAKIIAEAYSQRKVDIVKAVDENNPVGGPFELSELIGNFLLYEVKYEDAYKNRRKGKADKDSLSNKHKGHDKSPDLDPNL